MKRCFDVVAALGLLCLFAPLFPLVAVAVFCFLGRPVIFIQRRPGKGGRIFSLYKFRSMLVERSGGVGEADKDRLTKFGKFLRKTSLDELPQLWNVLKGDMSLVGPRPLLVEYLPLYTEEQARRHEVRPGITGWAQVNGRNAVSWEEKFALDVWYVENQSFLLDLKIVFLTAWKVFRSEGVAAKGQATTEYFQGSKT